MKRPRRNGVGSTGGGSPVDHGGDETAGAGADAEAVARAAGGDKKAGQGVDRRNDRDRVGHHVDHAAPAFGDLAIAKDREGLGHALLRAIEDIGVGLGVEHAHRLERRFLVQ